ncbi:MAG: enoyl-CoA hydratase/isomerase family protein [Betaproteobacteria bacterium]|nr:MAG: enoyl-CoA hydratase/isomerase family protein [Betaproteobacteria bacterium]
MFKVAVEGATLLITLDRAPVNAINEAWIEQLHAVLDRHEAGDQARVLRFRSSLKLFSAGADINFLIERLSTPAGIDAMLETVRKMQGVYDRIERSPLVSIAEIGGAALGGGFELALACDFRVAAASAKVGLPEARLSLLPGAGGTQRLTRLCGAALARRLILGAEVLEGTEAARLGLVHWAVPSEQLAAFTDELARRLGSLPRHTLEANKRCILAAQERDPNGFKLEVEMTRLLYEHPESLKRLRAFVAERTKR